MLFLSKPSFTRCYITCMIVLLNLEVTKKVNDNCYIGLMHLLKTLVSRLAKYFHLNLGRLHYEKKLEVRAKVKYLSKHEPKATKMHAAKKNRK